MPDSEVENKAITKHNDDSPKSLLHQLLEKDDEREEGILDALERCKLAIEAGKMPDEPDYITLVAVVAAGGDRYNGSLKQLKKSQDKEPTPFLDINPKPFQGGDMNQG